MESINSFIGNINGDLTHETTLLLHSYMDNTFRMIIFIYTLAISVVAITKGHPIIWITSSLMIILSISYAIFVIYNIGNLLREHVSNYHTFNIWFYYAQCAFLIILYISMLYYYVKIHKRS